MSPAPSRPVRTRTLASLLALVLLLPGFAAAQSAAFPDDLTPLARKWLDEARAAGEGHEGREWYPEAAKFLDQAEAALEEGRFRVAIFDIETYYELLETGRLMDDAAALGSDAERKSLALQRTNAWAGEAKHEWTQARAQLHAFDGELRSLVSVERALYAADVALSARVVVESHAMLAKEYSKQPKFEEGYVLALVTTSHTPLLNLRWAQDIAETVAALEGLEPSLDLVQWANVTALTLESPDTEQMPPYYEPYEKLAEDVRANDEGLMAIAIYLAELREARKNSIYLIFGDAQSREKDVVNDSARSLRKQLDNSSIEEPRAYGLEGVFTADAMDRSAYTLEFAGRGETTLGLVVASWSALDHADFVIDLLAQVSPIAPAAADVEDKNTPGFAPALVAAALAVGAFAARGVGRHGRR